uniref:Uncharacterized protein n=1 Tax=Heterorhabditis bacteriophora TaxID=37862 RepID=A0A1I7WJY1_HETBA
MLINKNYMGFLYINSISKIFFLLNRRNPLFFHALLKRNYHVISIRCHYLFQMKNWKRFPKLPPNIYLHQEKNLWILVSPIILNCFTSFFSLFLGFQESSRAVAFTLLGCMTFMSSVRIFLYHYFLKNHYYNYHCVTLFFILSEFFLFLTVCFSSLKPIHQFQTLFSRITNTLFSESRIVILKTDCYNIFY